MQRYHKDKHIRLNRVKRFETICNTKVTWPYGHYDKHNIINCGRSKCRICNYSKIYDLQTPKGYLADLNFEEQLEELSEFLEKIS